MQMLVQFDLNPPDERNDPGAVNRAIGEFWEMLLQAEADALAMQEHGARVVFTTTKPGSLELLEKIKEFAEARMRGVWSSRGAIDAALEPLLKNWQLYRLGTVERNVLRLAVWEIWNCEDIPAPIVINEAVDLAKFFSETKSGRFVNGVLDKNVQQLLAAKPGGNGAAEAEGDTWTPGAEGGGEDGADGWALEGGEEEAAGDGAPQGGGW